MSTALVTRDTEGRPINIGPWDYRVQPAANRQPVVTNPLPAGATQAEEEIIALADGGRWPAADPVPAWAANLEAP